MSEKTGFRWSKDVSVQDLDWHVEKYGGLWWVQDSSWHEHHRLEKLFTLPSSPVSICPVIVDEVGVRMAEWRPDGETASTSARLAYDLGTAVYWLKEKTKAREAAEKSLNQVKAEEEKARRRIELLNQGMPWIEQDADKATRMFLDLSFLTDECVRAEATRRGMLPKE